MRLPKIILTLVICSLIFINFSGCQNAETAQTEDLTTANVIDEEISAIQTYERVENKEIVVLLDVRTPEEYEEYHLSDAILMPLQTLEDDLAANTQFDKDDEIIVYCRSGRRSMEAFNILTKLGYSNVKSMAGGIKQWSAHGYNTCSGEHMTC
ncbi:rhodanese-like domain-containing protein [Patescibacteria group bacterium]